MFATDRRIFAIGYEYTPDHRLLGIKFCTNRIAGLWEFAIPEVSAEEEILRCRAVKRTQASLSVRCPRVHFVDGNPSSLVWISNPVGGPHASCSTVHVCDLKADFWAEKVLVESVSNPQSDTFPGIFTTTLPTEPFIVYNNETFLVTGSAWRSRTTILLISLDTGKVNNLTPLEDVHCCSWNVLGTDGHNQLIAVRSSPTSPPELVIGQVLSKSDVQWKQIVKPQLTDSRTYSLVVPMNFLTKLAFSALETGLIEDDCDTHPGSSAHRNNFAWTKRYLPSTLHHHSTWRTS